MIYLKNWFGNLCKRLVKSAGTAQKVPGKLSAWPECDPPTAHRSFDDGTYSPRWIMVGNEYHPYMKTLVEGRWRWVFDPVEQARYAQKVADLGKRNARKEFLKKSLGTRIVSEEEYAEAVGLGEDLFRVESTYYPGVWYSTGDCENAAEGARSRERFRMLGFMDLIAAQARLRKIERGEV